ncbi:MAG: hypothetical protein ACI9C4_003063, partial [Paraglaciecola sp.]
MFLLKGLINMITNLKRLAQASVILSALTISSRASAALIDRGNGLISGIHHTAEGKAVALQNLDREI